MPTTQGKGWLIAEDDAMKTYLGGAFVTDETSPPAGRTVPVWYRLPEMEERQRAYPYIVIDLLDIVPAEDRTQVGRLNVSRLGYAPPDPLPADVAGKSNTADWPIPVDLHYQITHVARSARHDRQLQRLMWQKFPGKWGTLRVPNDQTDRTMQLLGRSAAHDVDEFGKRQFRGNYTVSVASELWPSVIRQIQNLTDITIGIGVTTRLSPVGIHLTCHE